jgi:hypothetical protein
MEASLNHLVILFFCFLRNHHTVFHSSCTIVHSHQWHMNTLASPISSVKLKKNPDRCEVISHLVLIYLIIKDKEHRVDICLSSLEKYLCKSFGHFLLDLLISCHWVVIRVPYIFGILTS